MPLYVLEPPLRYTHAYAGPVIERVLPLNEARAACALKGVHADACSWVAQHTCHIVIPRGGPVKDLSAYRRHERAHCNGWDHDHAVTELPTPSSGAEGER
ncbi:MAG TPA: hypothetical protein VH206_03680 [Xanthobacteraceae bacterium]|jgi:hypothetical protein|nr:hypothetical protein [Xanthobacteraceae bacterium]